MPATRCLAIGLLGAALTAGCTSHQAVGLVPSTSPIDGPYDIRRPIRAEACQDYWLGFIRAGEGPDTVEEALRRAGGPLVRVTIDVESIFWVFGYTRCVVVAGHRIRQTPSADARRVGASPISSTGASRLTPGQSVRVALKDGTVAEGLVRSHTADTLHLETSSGPVSVETHRIESVAPAQQAAPR